MNIINHKCIGEILDKDNNVIPCPNTKADVLAILGDKILLKCTNGVNSKKITFAHQYTIKPKENKEWKKFFGEKSIKKLTKTL